MPNIKAINVGGIHTEITKRGKLLMPISPVTNHNNKNKPIIIVPKIAPAMPMREMVFVSSCGGEVGESLIAYLFY